MDESIPTQKSANDLSTMERLHAYWRMPYILASKNRERSDNPFIHITETSDDAKEYILHRGMHNYIVMNRHPYNAGHLLVVPFREVARLEDLNNAERYELIPSRKKNYVKWSNLFAVLVA